MTRVEDFLGELQKNAADMLHKDDKKKNETDDSEAEATGRRLLVLGDGEQPDGEQPNDKKKNETQVDYIIEEIKNKKEENKAFLEDAHNKLKEFLKDGMDSLYSTFKKSGKLLKVREKKGALHQERKKLYDINPFLACISLSLKVTVS